MNRSRDWINQAQADCDAANNSLNAGDYAWACFLAQQAAEKALKSIGEKLNLVIWGHDLVDILKQLKTVITIPTSIELHCKTLNLYYTSTRYPDVFSSGFPAEKFSDAQAREAIKLACEVITFARSKII